MVEVSMINGKTVLVNPDLIRLIETTPDTVLTFTDGERLLVCDKPQEIVDKIIHYRRACHMPTVASERPAR